MSKSSDLSRTTKMQENALEWTPMYEPHMYWEVRIFIFYLLFVLAFLAYRSAQLVWFLWRSRRQSAPLATQSCRQSSLAFASTKMLSLNRLAVFIGLLSLLTLL